MSKPDTPLRRKAERAAKTLRSFGPMIRMMEEDGRADFVETQEAVYAMLCLSPLDGQQVAELCSYCIVRGYWRGRVPFVKGEK